MAVNNKENKEQNDKIVGELFEAFECDTAISRVAAKFDDALIKDDNDE